MDARLDYYGSTIAAKFTKYINSAGAVVSDSALPAATQELVKIRASQINGCAACTDMHTKGAGHAGEGSGRLNLVAVWREATVFTEAERAALELTEQGTRIADAAGGVTDEAWANAAKHYDDEQLAALVALIALINTYNRLNVHHPPARRRLPARSVGIATVLVRRARKWPGETFGACSPSRLPWRIA
jgi:AhpD family alkylhydroperoxidase